MELYTDRSNGSGVQAFTRYGRLWIEQRIDFQAAETRWQIVPDLFQHGHPNPAGIFPVLETLVSLQGRDYFLMNKHPCAQDDFVSVSFSAGECENRNDRFRSLPVLCLRGLFPR